VGRWAEALRVTVGTGGARHRRAAVRAGCCREAGVARRVAGVADLGHWRERRPEGWVREGAGAALERGGPGAAGTGDQEQRGQQVCPQPHRNDPHWCQGHQCGTATYGMKAHGFGYIYCAPGRLVAARAGGRRGGREAHLLQRRHRLRVRNLRRAAIGDGRAGRAAGDVHGHSGGARAGAVGLAVGRPLQHHGQAAVAAAGRQRRQAPVVLEDRVARLQGVGWGAGVGWARLAVGGAAAGAKPDPRAPAGARRDGGARGATSRRAGIGQPRALRRPGGAHVNAARRAAVGAEFLGRRRGAAVLALQGLADGVVVARVAEGHAGGRVGRVAAGRGRLQVVQPGLRPGGKGGFKGRRARGRGCTPMAGPAPGAVAGPGRAPAASAGCWPAWAARRGGAASAPRRTWPLMEQ
jgi:hypothetical protein